MAAMRSAESRWLDPPDPITWRCPTCEYEWQVERGCEPNGECDDCADARKKAACSDDRLIFFVDHKKEIEKLEIKIHNLEVRLACALEVKP